jgi:hypothetical protein
MLFPFMSLWKEHPKDVQTILGFVMDYKLLPYHEFIIEYLNKKVEMTHKVLEEYKVFWKKTKCRFMIDGWTYIRNRTILIFWKIVLRLRSFLYQLMLLASLS